MHRKIFDATSVVRPALASNRFGVDYREVAARLGPPVRPIIDSHLHVNGAGAARVFAPIARAFGVMRLYSQTRLDQAPAVREVLGDLVRFVAVPAWGEADRKHAFGPGFLDGIRAFHAEHRCRIIKFWNAPRLRDLITGADAEDYLPFDAPWRVKAAELASSLGMMFQCHVADPDTWFATKYADARKYGAKREAYASLERMLARFRAPWIAAHMGGWPEDLAFLSDLLARHDNLYLDASATKWIVREVSKHPRHAVLAFMSRWKGRILFGSDIVTTDEHLTPKDIRKQHPMGDLADGPEAAFDLYASRYAALRAMWETDYEGESPIADPDLVMVDPARHTPMSAPMLRGFSLPPDILREFYADAAARVFKNYE
jgi:hypothetical protein